ncbi:hypothetical protein L6452_07126 [Arctium lappa]|uniref:Uncharacterized protein n=1 Tax=Arctium lappa TaxID=4217 RepID=A0ACB9EL56_ARCLA|nr:hypothetical protein L6452_07126 [Arctium lappa]
MRKLVALKIVNLFDFLMSIVPDWYSWRKRRWYGCYGGNEDGCSVTFVGGVLHCFGHFSLKREGDDGGGGCHWE